VSDRFNPLAAYSGGLVGAVEDPRAEEMFGDSILRSGGHPDGGVIAHQWEFAGAGAGKLSLLFPTVLEVFPDSLPGPGQLTGDCVSVATARAILISMALEIADGKPDEVTGKIEEAPPLSTMGVMQGVVATESLWAWRGYDGDGWNGSAASQVATQKGFLFRKEYPELGIDLTKYTRDTIRIGGRRVPGEKWLGVSKEHRPRTATFLKGREQVRDFIAAGYGIMNTSSMGFSSSRNEDGVSRQQGRWAHAQHYLGYDDRPETHRKYGQALVLWNNQWNVWNSGPRRIMGTNIDIPPGSFWALASTIDRCTNIALSSVAGWPKRQHTTYGAAGNL
jgi:hypothetical protein